MQKTHLKTYINTRKEKYIASLFDDVNEIAINKKQVLLYPHQIKIVQNSNEKALVKNSYFKGNFWLIEVEYNNQLIFLNHPLVIKRKETVSLKFNKPI